MRFLRPRTCLAILAFSLLLAPGIKIVSAQQIRPKLRYLLTESDALILNRAEILAASEVREAQWSPDGTYALALREATPLLEIGQPPAPSEVSLSVWYNGSRRVRTLWSGKTFLMDAKKRLYWLPRSDIALALFVGRDEQGQRTTHLLWIDPAHEKAREILPALPFDQLLVSPTQPVAIVAPAYASVANAAFHIVRADGSSRETAPLPETKGYATQQWTRDGKAFCVILHEPHINPDKPDESTETVTAFALNLTTGEWTPAKAPNAEDLAQEETPKPDAPKNSAGLHITRLPRVLEQGDTKQTVHPAWLETEAKTDTRRVLLTADCEDAQISPKGNAVLYRTQGAAFVVPISRVPAAPFVQALRATVMSNAKQVGLGIMMYVQDYDERFPLANFNIPDVIEPYTKNPEIFENFVYNFPGEELAKIEKPAETILGVITGPGGEAVLYADGHVKWREKK